MRAAETSTAIMLVLAATMLSAVDAVIVRLLARGVHPLTIAFFRALFGLITVLPWILTRIDLAGSPYRGLHLLRAAMKQTSLVAIFLAFAHAPLADAVAITFTAPIFLALGAYLMLGESLNAARVLALVAGFTGILIIVRPGAASFDPWLLSAVVGALLMAIIQLMLRQMTQHDSPDRLVAWNLVAMVPIGFVAMLPVWETPTLAQLGLMALQGGLGALNMTLMTRAFSLAEATVLAPFDYLRLPAVAAMAYLIFAEPVALTTWIGFAAIILGAALGARRRR